MLSGYLDNSVEGFPTLRDVAIGAKRGSFTYYLGEREVWKKLPTEKS